MPWFLRCQFVYFLVLLSLLIGCVAPHSPEPSPKNASLTNLAKQSTVDYSQRLAAVFEKVAQQLEAGEITSAARANQALAEGNRAARVAAFAPVNEAVYQQIGDDRWNAATAAQLFHEIAQGHRKVQP